MSKEQNKGVMSSAGYFKRAKVFGYMMLIVAIGYLVYYLIERYS